MVATNEYGAEQIETVPPYQGIRRRPGMYVGDTDDPSGMHHMLWEIVGNALDECLRRGGPGRVHIEFDGERVSVDDDGRGIAVGVLPDGRSSLELLMTTWRPLVTAPPHVHLRPGLHGVGVVPVCALSSELEVESRRDGRVYGQRFSRGAAVGPMEDLGPATKTGTRVSFTPDFTVFTRHPWNIPLVAGRCRELAALYPGLTVAVEDEIYCSRDGAVDYVRYLAGDGPLIDPFHARVHRDGIDVEIAVAWIERDGAAVHSFVNLCATRDGTHIEGMFAGLRTVLAPRIKALRRVGPIKLRERLSRGMIAIVHASLVHPRFGNPTKDWLKNEEVGDAVRSVVEAELPAHFERNPALLDWLILRLSH